MYKSAMTSSSPPDSAPPDSASESAIRRLLAIMARLRDPDGGCPWDVEQTFATIAPHTIEEAYEVADAIERGDMADLKDELGDLLLQVVFHAQMAEEDSLFDFDAVATAISDKLVRRHPHVFADTKIETADAQTEHWEALKAEERAKKNGNGNDDAPESALDGVTLGLPAMTRAVKLQKRAARVGFDWALPADVLHKLAEEVAEVEHEIATDGGPERLKDEVGDILFVVANLARKLNIDPEEALRAGNAKFEARFRRVETLLAERGKGPKDSTLEEMDALWNVAKTEGL